MPRTSIVHYIAPSAISITPNANNSANDLAVYLARGAKIKVYSRRAGIDTVNGAYQEWTITGRNRRLADSNVPYTIYARLHRTDHEDGYLIFAPQQQNASDEWIDKYPSITPDGLSTSYYHPADNVSIRYWFVRLGEVTLPENGKRAILLDTGILGTDDFNTNWALNPDAMPLRIELGCTIDDEDAGPTPYVYWGQTLQLVANLVEGWTGTDIERFDHWEITRNSGDEASDTAWASGTKAVAFQSTGAINLSHARGANDDFNGAVSVGFTIVAMENTGTMESPVYAQLVSASINIHAETVENYVLSLSSSIVSYNPQTETFSPSDGVNVSVRATDQRGDVYDLTRGQLENAGLVVGYAPLETEDWTNLVFGGASTSKAIANIGTAAFSTLKSLVVRIARVISGSTLMELNRATIAYLRDGEDSREREWIFLQSEEEITFGNASSEHPLPSLISGGQVNPSAAATGTDTNKNQDGWVPEGWWDEQQGVSEEYAYEYGSYRDYIRESESTDSSSSSSEETGGHWGDFSTPRIWNHYASDAVTYDIVPNVSVINANAAGVVSSDGIVIQAFRTKGVDRSDNILPPVTGSTYYIEYSIDSGTWTSCAMFSYQPEGETAVQSYGIAPSIVAQARTGIALRLKNSDNASVVLKENAPIRVVRIVSEEETQEIVRDEGDVRYFRKDQPDTSPYTATFGGVHIAAGLSDSSDDSSSSDYSEGNLEVDGDTSIGGELSVGETATIPTINPNAIPSNFPDPEGSVSNPWGISPKGIAKLTKLLIEEIQNVGGTDLESLLGQGFLYKMDEYGKAHVFTDYLTVRLKAYFAELEIRRLSYVGGSIVLTPAGSKVKGVVWLDANGEVLTQEAGNRSSVKAFKVYEEADDGTFATQNGWKVGDMARCETFNIDGAGKYQDVSNTYYWRLVTDAGQVRLDSDGNEVGQNAEGYADAKVTNFIILSNEASVEVDNVVLVGYDLSGDNDFPQAGDTLVQMGNQFPTNHADENYSTRGNIIMLRTVSESANPDGAPSIVMYKNVGSVDAGSSNPYTLANRRIMKFGLDGLTVISDYFTLTSQRGDVRPVSFYRGDWSATDTYNERDTVTYDDRLWQCLQDNVTGSGTYAPYIGSPYWQCVVKGKSTSIYSIECSTYLVSTASLSNVVPTVLGAEMDSALYPVLFGEYLLKIGEEEEGSTAVISIRAVLQDGEGKSYLDSGTLVVQNMVGSAVINTIDTSTTGEISILYSDIDPNADRVRISYRADGTNEDAATSITLVRNGVDGSAVRIDLDNENDSMLYDERGTLISGNVVSNVSLYDGMDDKTSEVVALGGFSIAASSGCTASISDNVVTVTGMSATSGYVTVQASYNSKTWRTKLTLKKIVNGRKFEIVATPTSIAKNTTTGIQSSGSIECFIYVTDKEGRRKVTNLTDEGVVLYFGAKLANGNEDYNNVNSAYSSSGFVVNNLSPTSEKAFFFRLTDATNQNTILDEETIPINRSADGANADSAPYLTINPSTIFFEKDANEEVEATKSYISNVKMYHNNVEVTLVNVTIDSAPSGATVNLEDIEYNTAQISVALAKNTSAASVSGVIAFTVAGTLNNESYTCKGFITLAGVPAGTAGVDAEFLQLVDEGSKATIAFTYDEETAEGHDATTILETAVLKLNIKASVYQVIGNTQSQFTTLTGYSLRITYGYGGSTVNISPAPSADSSTHLFTYETASPYIAIGANFTPNTVENTNYMSLSPTVTLQLLDSNNNAVGTSLQVPITGEDYERFIRTAKMMESVYANGQSISSFTQTANGFDALVTGLGASNTGTDEAPMYSSFNMTNSTVIFDTENFKIKHGNLGELSIFTTQEDENHNWFYTINSNNLRILGNQIKLEGYTVINGKFSVATNGDVYLKNAFVEGVINNLVQTINSVNLSEFGYSSTNALSNFNIDPLSCGNVIKFDYTGVVTIHLPYAYQNGDEPYINHYRSGVQDPNRTMTTKLNEIRQCVGKKIWILAPGSSSDTAESQRIKFQTGNDRFILRKWTIYDYSSNEASDLATVIRDNSSESSLVTIREEANLLHEYQPQGGYQAFLLECKMGIYNGCECIYWELTTKGTAMMELSSSPSSSS